MQPNNHKERCMPKAYWVATYHAIHDVNAFAAYAKLAGPALSAAGGKVLARGDPAQVYDAGKRLRVVLIEFPSVRHAVAAHDSPAYAEALRALGSAAVEREIRIVEGVE
jgi:uncharacterized protein (DUF1330 family)